jgi:predicted RNase H-like HicB family nuclease
MGYIITFSICLPVIIKKRAKWYVASCFPLDIHAQGDTAKKAKESLKEALYAFIGSCMRRGTFDAVLKECGITPVKSIKTISTKIPKRQECIDIPIYYNAPSRYSLTECHA